jgi:hypothetical protein
VMFWHVEPSTLELGVPPLTFGSGMLEGDAAGEAPGEPSVACDIIACD